MEKQQVVQRTCFTIKSSGTHTIAGHETRGRYTINVKNLQIKKKAWKSTVSKRQLELI